MTQVMTDSVLSNGVGKLTSVSGYALLLDEDSIELREYALRELNTVVDGHWFEMAEYLASIENCFEDEMFPSREQAALLASKIYFHMEDYDEALKYLLSSYRLFDPLDSSSFSESMVVKCIDEFIKVCKAHYNNTNNDHSDSDIDIDHYLKNATVITVNGLDSRLEEIVSDLISRSNSNGRFLNAMGIALEARRSDLLVKILKQTLEGIHNDNLAQFCDQCFNLIRHLDSNQFRFKSYKILIKLIEEKVTYIEDNPSLKTYCECLCVIGDSEKLFTILMNLSNDLTNFSKAYSIAFIIKDYENVTLMNNIISKIDFHLLGVSTKTEVEECKDSKSENQGQSISNDRLNKIRSILTGEAVSELNLQFLYLNNQPDLGVLEHIKNNCDQRSAISHTAIVMSHGLMQAGTTCDVFLRNNLEWLGRATHWSRFSTASSLGIIHMGHIKEAFKVLSTCLPNGGNNNNTSSNNNSTNSNSGGNALGGQYSEGGSFFALGLINASYMDPKAKEYLLEKLRNPQRNEVLQHGASLGLGIMGFGSCDTELYDELRNVLYMDNAVAGEAAAYGLGLVMFGSGSKKAIGDLLSYAKDTQHEKIVRACSVALGFVMFSQSGEEANELFQQLNSDSEHFIRYGAMHVLGLAYCGTGNEFAMEKLLHASVSELSDDNKRAAVFALGLVMCRNTQQIPQVFSLLCDSYNPHVRYAAALTLGITCCGMESPKITAILQSMTTDSTDIVRQAAYIGLGLLLMQQNESSNDKFTCIRQQMIKTATDKHEHIATRFGAILGLGLMDAGGRNVKASLFSRNEESLRAQSVAGFSLFFQFWFWFPLVHCISLSYIPTYIVGLDDQLRVPKSFSMQCNSAKEKFDYPKSFSLDKNEDKKVVVTAVLSTASKKKSKKQKSIVGDTGNGAKEINDSSSPLSASKQVNDEERIKTELSKTLEDEVDTKMNIEEKTEKEEVEMIVEGGDSENSKGNDKKSNSFVLNNPFRILKSQEQFLEYIPDSRYLPVLPLQKSGFILLKDNKPSEQEEYLFTVGQDSNKDTISTFEENKETGKEGEESNEKKEKNDDEKMFDNDDGKFEEMVPPETFEWQG
ncbi:RPN2 26s proteasome regulatory subunit [Cryptosporidium ubiquitum]|uniref:RPN2 26s proteasome regulatory subunit n=1 Tax=Cryptosporidium ubiquitum TaxID=857276 RepID=A0A1J4MER3_9CRYT|nr:RPN2 26s proteasome regulatory subunit [Cryptosporidium ubiquitum]OII72697.1 RPN2 26s proteasome regulatory subunit [Cryptosporidium ubiquitum]